MKILMVALVLSSNVLKGMQNQKEESATFFQETTNGFDSVLPANLTDEQKRNLKEGHCFKFEKFVKNRHAEDAQEHSTAIVFSDAARRKSMDGQSRTAAEKNVKGRLFLHLLDSGYKVVKSKSSLACRVDLLGEKDN